MTALDFFLYDNRTWSQRWGRDWGLKAATGVLAGRNDLKGLFDRYCGLLPSAQGQLRDFGEAIGGVRSPDRAGYLVCVTLESSDSFGRPSWAVIGLWCPDPVTLLELLRGDPVQAARGLLGNDTLPGAVELQPAKTAPPKPLRRTATGPSFHRFERGTTVREVKALLSGAAQGRTILPNVLGITATSRFAAVQQAGFDVTYCHPMNEQAERALARVVSPQDAVEEELPAPVHAEPERPDWPESVIDPPSVPAVERSWSPLSFLLAGVGLAVLVGLGLLFLGGSFPETVPAIEREAADAGAEPGGEKPAAKASSDEAVLKEVEERLGEIRDLEREELIGSASFQAAERLEVLPEHDGQRSRVRRAFENLMEIRSRVAGPVGSQDKYVAYYYDEGGKALPSKEKIMKITGILREAPLGQEDCAILKKAFGFEFESRESVLRRWCVSLAKLDQTAVKLPKVEPKADL